MRFLTSFLFFIGLTLSSSWVLAQSKKLQGAQSGKTAEGCYACMADCPHSTREGRPCDDGCPDSCDALTMKQAYFKMAERAIACESKAAPSASGTSGSRKSRQSPSSGGGVQ